MLSAALLKCTYFILFTEKSKLLLEQNALAMQAWDSLALQSSVSIVSVGT